MAQVKAAEDAWNTRNPEAVSRAYTPDSRWRNRSEFFAGRPEIVAFLTRKWQRELDYRLRKELWAFTDDRIAVRFQYEVLPAAQPQQGPCGLCSLPGCLQPSTGRARPEPQQRGGPEPDSACCCAVPRR